MLKKEYIKALSKCPLFTNIELIDYTSTIMFLDGKVQIYQKGETILHFDDIVTRAYIVIDGSAEGSFLNEGFNQINMNTFKNGDLFAEALACLNKKSPMEIIAKEKTIMLLVNLRSLYDNESIFSNRLILCENLITSLAKKDLFLNLKVRLLSTKSLRERILMYVSTLLKNQYGYHMVPYNKTDLAMFLGVNRSALSREISRMKEEGIIKTLGRDIMIV